MIIYLLLHFKEIVQIGLAMTVFWYVFLCGTQILGGVVVIACNFWSGIVLQRST